MDIEKSTNLFDIKKRIGYLMIYWITFFQIFFTSRSIEILI